MKAFVVALALVLGVSGPALCQAVCATTSALPAAAASTPSCHEGGDDSSGPMLGVGATCQHDGQAPTPTQLTSAPLAAIPTVLPATPSGAEPDAFGHTNIALVRSSPPPLLLSLRI